MVSCTFSCTFGGTISGTIGGLISGCTFCCTFLRCTFGGFPLGGAVSGGTFGSTFGCVGSVTVFLVHSNAEGVVHGVSDVVLFVDSGEQVRHGSAGEDGYIFSTVSLGSLGNSGVLTEVF